MLNNIKIVVFAIVKTLITTVGILYILGKIVPDEGSPEGGALILVLIFFGLLVILFPAFLYWGFFSKKKRLKQINKQQGLDIMPKSQKAHEVLELSRVPLIDKIGFIITAALLVIMLVSTLGAGGLLAFIITALLSVITIGWIATHISKLNYLRWFSAALGLLPTSIFIGYFLSQDISSYYGSRSQYLKETTFDSIEGSYNIYEIMLVACIGLTVLFMVQRRIKKASILLGLGGFFIAILAVLIFTGSLVIRYDRNKVEEALHSREYKVLQNPDYNQDWSWGYDSLVSRSLSSSYGHQGQTHQVRIKEDSPDSEKDFIVQNFSVSESKELYPDIEASSLACRLGYLYDDSDYKYPINMSSSSVLVDCSEYGSVKAGIYTNFRRGVITSEGTKGQHRGTVYVSTVKDDTILVASQDLGNMDDSDGEAFKGLKEYTNFVTDFSNYSSNLIEVDKQELLERIYEDRYSKKTYN